MTYLYYIFLGIVTVITADANRYSRCNHPCSRINRGTFTNGIQNFVFACNQTNIVRVIDIEGNRFVEDRECYKRNGPFLSFRVGNRYQCFKDTVYDPVNTDIVFIYFAQPKTIVGRRPSICELCSGPLTRAMFVHESVDLEEARRRTEGREPELGCNVPLGCRKDSNRDEICTRNTPKEDNGRCCSNCQYDNYGYNRKCRRMNKRNRNQNKINRNRINRNRRNRSYRE